MKGSSTNDSLKYLKHCSYNNFIKHLTGRSSKFSLIFSEVNGFGSFVALVTSSRLIVLSVEPVLDGSVVL
jgi:hypothetical protein